MKAGIVKKVLAVAMTVTMTAVVAGCGGEASSAGNAGVSEPAASESAEVATAEGDVQVGIVLPTKDEPRWIQDETRFASILDEAGFSYQVLFSQGNSATEKSNVETLISRGADVLIICPHDATAVASAVEEAHDAGVTVVSYDTLVQMLDISAYFTHGDQR